MALNANSRRKRGFCKSTSKILKTMVRSKELEMARRSTYADVPLLQAKDYACEKDLIVKDDHSTLWSRKHAVKIFLRERLSRSPFCFKMTPPDSCCDRL